MKYYLIDNQRYSISQFFTDNVNNFNHLCIATGYVDLPALCQILPLLKNYCSIKLLIGQEPLIHRYKKNSVENDFPKLDLTNDLQELNIDPKFANTIQLIKDLIKTKQLEIKVFKRTFLHAKCFIFSNQLEENLLSKAIGIIGSSNLTGNGISSNKNIELNHVEHNEMIVKYPSIDKEPNLIGHYAWFNELWNDESAENWDGQFTEILEKSPVGELMFSQYEMYIKTLWEMYQDEVEIAGEQVSKGYTLFEYQLKNANSLCKRLDKRKLAMLCDSVGLGKTITALEVITRYVKIGKRVVVICPKSLKNQWEHASRKQNLNIDVLSLQNDGELNKHIEFDRYAPVGLFVIDESHNLRIGAASSRFELVRQWINKNKHAHSLLLTATPINNSITDLLNQILLGSGGDANVLMIPTSNGTGMRNVVDVINSIRKSESLIENLTPELIAERRAKLHPILKEFVVRRTRQGILKEQEVSNFEPKLHFPQEKLHSRSYGFAPELVHTITDATIKLSYDTVTNIGEIVKNIYLVPELYSEYDEEQDEYIEKTLDDKLTILKHPMDQLNIFKQLHPIKYIETGSPLRLVYQIIQFLGFIPYRYMIYHHNFYAKEMADVKLMPPTPQRKILNRQKGLYGILRIVFLKRLESSFYALQVSLNNYRNTLNTFKNALDRKVILPLSQLRDVIEEYGDDYTIDNIPANTDAEFQFEFTEFNHQQMYSDITKELALLDVLDIQLNLLKRDNNKIKDLSELFTSIKTEYQHYNNGKPKILVFSYFADTIKHLEKEFKDYFAYAPNECAFISASNRNNIDDLTRRFAPKGKDYTLATHEQELQYLFATDVLSEGQNLQDCTILINYDLHWNPVRMIQRNGRINRIGSEYDNVLIYNMHPNSQLEEYLKLVKRLEYKIGLIRDVVGQDQRILNADEKINPIEFVDDIEIEKLQGLYSSNEDTANKILIELEGDEEFLTDEKFITDLRYFDSKYKDNPEYKKDVYNIPKGKFGLLAGKSNQLLIFTQMNDDKHNKLFNKFFMINNKNPKSIDDLHALQLIRTDENNNQRQNSQLYKLYLPYLTKEYSQEFIRMLQASNNTERIIDTGMENLRTKFLHLLIDMGYSELTRDIFDKALSYCNHSDFNLISKKLKKLLKAPSSKEITQLLDLCEKSIVNLDKTKTIIQATSCEGVLYYGN
ncbi:MAG: helicase-related protein [Burkholderiales bacterium]|nr:helicase-related protein [Burkholderiales bacterium]